MAFIPGFYTYLSEIEGKNENLRAYPMESKEVQRLQVLARLSEREEPVNEREALKEVIKKEKSRLRRMKSLHTPKKDRILK